MNNFTPRAQQVLAHARREADRFNHHYIGTEHLLLGLLKLGKGVAVSFMDKASIAQPELFAELLRLAEGSGIAHQVKMAVAGGNDSGPAQRAGCGAKVCVLSVPCRYIHSPSTVLCLEDVEAQYLLAKAYLTR